MSIFDLILFSLSNIEAQGKKADFEEIIKKCFLLFPDNFRFKRHKKWPDARKLDSSLRKLRQRKLITGTPSDGFKLTGAGKKQVQEIAKALRQKKLL